MSVIGTVRKASSRAKIFAVLAVLLMILSTWVFIADDSSDSSAAGELVTNNVTYYRNASDMSSSTNGVSVSYYDISSTEYNPEFWQGTGKISGSTPNWSGPSISKTGQTITLKATASNASDTITITIPDDDGGTLGSVASYTVTGVTSNITAEGSSCTYSGNVISLVPKDTVQHTVTVTYTVTYKKVFGGWTDGTEFIVKEIDQESTAVVFKNPIDLAVNDYVYTYDPNKTYRVSEVISQEDVKSTSDGDQVIISGEDVIVVKNISGLVVGSNITAVSGGEYTVTGIDTDIKYNSYLPGDAFPRTVAKLYSMWIGPDLFRKTGDVTVTSNSFNVNSESLLHPYYAPVRTSGGALFSNSNWATILGSSYNIIYGVDQNGNQRSTPSMYGTIVKLFEANGATSNSVTGYKSFSLTGASLPTGSYRGEGKALLYFNGNAAKLGGHAIIDNISIHSGSLESTHGAKTNSSIVAQGKILIIGTNVTNPGLVNDAETRRKNAPQLFGGSADGNLSGTALVEKKDIVFGKADHTKLRVDLATCVIVHSGVWNNVIGACVGKDIGTQSIYRSTYVVMKGGWIIDTIVGGIGGNTNNWVYGGLDSTRTENAGGTFVYALGGDMPANRWQDGQTGTYLGDVVRSGFNNVESSVLEGGGNQTKVSGSTHVFVSDESTLWDVQAGGRHGLSYCSSTYLEITGKSIVRHAACGTITDGSDKNSTSTYSANVYVGGDAFVGNVFGAGYDTYTDPKGRTMSSGTINVTIENGKVGNVFGGGYRGSIGDPNHTTDNNALEITITVSGGEILGDLYGGGSGGLDKAKNKIDGSFFDFITNGGSGNKNSTGYSYVYGKITIKLNGGQIDGNVYGGGKSVPTMKSYTGASFNSQDNPLNVAAVIGSINVELNGSVVNGNVYGGGRGIDDTREIVGNKVRWNYDYSRNICLIYSNGEYKLGSIAFAGAGAAEGSIPYVYYYDEDYKVDGSTYDGTYKEHYKEFANTDGNITVDIKSGTIKGDLYGGSALGRVHGNISIHIVGGHIMGAVYGGGLGVIGNVSTTGKRKITVAGDSDIKGSIYGGSALGTDGLEDTFDSGSYDGRYDAVIYLKAGRVDGSIFGGGFQGTTFANVHMYVGEDSLALKPNDDIVADTIEDNTISIGGSIYLGGDVGVLEDSSQAYTVNMVMGTGELYMAENDSGNLSFTGSIMGAGNSCLTKGKTTIHLKNIVSFSTAAAEAIHRATEVTMDGCVLELNGRATIENQLKNSNVSNTDYSLYKIEKLILKGGTTLVFNGSINFVYELESQNTNGDPTTATSPFNKVVIGGGNLFMMKRVDNWVDPTDYDESYGSIKGYAIIAPRSDENYGVLALGSPQSEGGFVVLKAGSFVKVDHSDLTETCRCWYIAGAINNEVTVTVNNGGLQDVSVSMPSLQSGSSYRYTGGTFIPESPGCDRFINTNPKDNAPGIDQFQLRFGLDDGSGECLVFTDEESASKPNKGALMENDFGEGDPILGKLTGLVSVRNPYMKIQVESNIDEFRYLGYVLIYVNEVVEVELNGETSYIVVNSIQTKVHIYTEANSLGDTEMDISIVNGTGSATFIIPSGMAGYKVVVESVQAKGVAGVSAFSMTAVKNTNNTPGWTDNLGSFVMRTDGSAIPTTVGTLQGGYSASLRIYVDSFSGSGVQNYDVKILIKDGSTTVKSFTLTLNVSRTPDVAVNFHVNSNTQLRYTYSYGTVISISDSPPTDPHFVGWYTDSNFNNPYTFTMPLTRDLELYARYMLEVTLDYMDGTSSVVYVAMPNGYIGSIENPTRPGYDFGGWWEDTEYTHSWNPATSLVTSDLTLYARWVGWNVKVEFEWKDPTTGVIQSIDLTALGEADNHSGDLLDCQIMEFGTPFNTKDWFRVYETGSRESMKLLEWAQYTLENDHVHYPSYYGGGYKFIYWTFKNENTIAVYTDSYLSDVGYLKINEETGRYYIDERGYYVVVLTAEASPVAVNVVMDSTVIIGGQSVDNLALVDPPSSFLIFPYDKVENQRYYMKINLNGATRPGYSLKGWTIADSSEQVPPYIFDRSNPNLYAAGTEIIFHAEKITGTYPWMVTFENEDGEPISDETMYLTNEGALRLFGESDNGNLVIKFESDWERIPYSVSIANPAHGTIYATYDNGTTVERIIDSTLYYGDTVTLVFTADHGYEFHQWYSSGEGLFNNANSSSTTFVVQGDTCISAYMIGPQIVRIFVEYDGLYKEVGIDSTVSADGDEYIVKSVNTDIYTAEGGFAGVKFIITDKENKYATVVDKGGKVVAVDNVLSLYGVDYTVKSINETVLKTSDYVRFIVTDAEHSYATVIYAPKGLDIHENDVIAVEEDYTVKAVNTEIYTVGDYYYKDVRYIITDDVNRKITVIYVPSGITVSENDRINIGGVNYTVDKVETTIHTVEEGEFRGVRYIITDDVNSEITVIYVPSGVTVETGYVIDGHTVEAVNTDIYTVGDYKGVRYIITDNGNREITVIYVPSGITVEVDDIIDINGVDYTVVSVCDVLQDPKNDVRFIVHDDVNKYVTIVEYYVDESMIPNLYWENDGVKVYFTKSVYTKDMGANDHTLVLYTGTATLGSHDIYLEGRDFGGEYNLGMPITSTTAHNAYYIMTPRELYTKPDIVGDKTSTTGVGFIVMDGIDNNVTVTAVPNSVTFTIDPILHVSGDTADYNVTGISLNAIRSTGIELLTFNGDVIYRYGYISVYTNNIKNHTRDLSSDDIAGIGSGISALKEYVLNYYKDDVTDPTVDKTSTITITIEAGYYTYTFDETAITSDDESETGNIPVGAISNNVISGAITQGHCTIDVYYGVDYPPQLGSSSHSIELYFGDSYQYNLDPMTTVIVPPNSYEIYAWFISRDGGVNYEPVTGSLTVGKDDYTAGSVIIYGKYVPSNNYTTIYVRVQQFDNSYVVNSVEHVVEMNDSVYYNVEPVSGCVARYILDTGVTPEILATKTYDPNDENSCEGLIDVLLGGKTLVITYYLERAWVRIYDANHDGTVKYAYLFGQTVTLVQSEDTVETHYEGWTRNGDIIQISMGSYVITEGDVTEGTEENPIVLAERSFIREYTVDIITARAEIDRAAVVGVEFTVGPNEYTVDSVNTMIYTVKSGDYEGVKFIITGDDEITVIYCNGKTITEDVTEITYGDHTYTVTSVNDTIMEVTNGDYKGTRFIADGLNATVIEFADRGKTVSLSIPYGTLITAESDRITLKVGSDVYVLSGYEEYEPYYDMSVSCWTGVPNNLNGHRFTVGLNEYTIVSVNSSIYTVKSGSFEGVKFIITDDENDEITVIYRNNKAITANVTKITYDEVEYTVTSVNDTILEVTSGIYKGMKFIADDLDATVISTSGLVTGDVMITYQWVSRTYTIRVVYDDTVTVSGTSGIDPILFDDVIYDVTGDPEDVKTLEDGIYNGVKFVILEDHDVMVFYIPGDVTIDEGDTFEFDDDTYTVRTINTTVKKDEHGREFIVTDWESRGVTVIDWNGQSEVPTLKQKGPHGTVTVTPVDNEMDPMGLGYGAIVRLTMVFEGSYTIDQSNSTYVGPDGETYNLQPTKQSSLQEYVIQFFVTGDMEITISSKWVGEHITFSILGISEESPVINPSMTLQVGRDEPVYISIADYEYMSVLDVPGYYFDGWYKNLSFNELPTVVFSGGRYCFELWGNTTLYARYVKIPYDGGDYNLTYDGTQQSVTVLPFIEVPLDVSAVSYTYYVDDVEREANNIAITDVNDDLNNKVIAYSYTPSKVYTIDDDGTERYILSGVNHAYEGSFTLRMNPRPIIVIADSMSWRFDGKQHVCESYSVFGLSKYVGVNDYLTEESEVAYGSKIINPGYVENVVSISYISGNYSVTYYNGTLMVIGSTHPTVKAGASVNEVIIPGNGAITVSYSSSEITVSQAGMTPKTISGSNVKLVINNKVITATGAPAITIGAGCNVTIVIEGDCAFTGGEGYDGIAVDGTATLKLTGTGSLTVYGNRGEEIAGKAGSGIGLASGSPGKITISYMGSLSAYGFGQEAYGIGGKGGTVMIDNSCILHAKGGLLGGSNDSRGGPGIGGLVVCITKSTVSDVTGGPNSAAIGGIADSFTYVEIFGSTLTGIRGGSYSAGIGGSIQTSTEATIAGSTDYIEIIKGRLNVNGRIVTDILGMTTVHIVGSSVTVVGGINGPGIGVGHATVSNGQGLCAIEIGSGSIINATGGEYAANIGTGYRHANLTGFVDRTVTHTSGARSDYVDSGNDTFTQAQDIGYGVIDLDDEGLGLRVFFYDGLSKISAPLPPS